MTGTHDVIVIGLGGIGSAACRSLALAGQRVLGLEQFGPAHAHGASHGLTRGVWQAYFMGPGYVPLLRRAYELWDELEATTGHPQLVRTGGICIGPQDGALVPAALASARACDLPHELLTAREVRRRYPQLAVGPDEVGLFDPTSGYVRPEQVVSDQLALAAALGAELRFHQPVTSIDSGPGEVTVTTSAGTFSAGRVVVAAGAWLPALLPAANLPVNVVRKVMHWFAPEAGVAAFRPDRQPYWIWESDGRVGYGHPAVDGPHGGAKAGFHDGGEPAFPDSIDRVVTGDEVELLRAWLRTRLPALSERHVRSTTCMYDNTPDLGFLLGALPEDPQVVVAGGTSGHAFKFVPALGEAIAEIVVEGRARHDLSLFAPDRFAPVLR